jgi:putative aldouronate transport system permease protein
LDIALQPARVAGRPRRWAGLYKELRRRYWLYLMLVPTLVYFAIFAYGPMFGVVIAFKNYSLFKGIAASPWVGLLHFQRFIQSPFFERLLRNTAVLGVYGLAVGTPIPIILALLINEVRSNWFRRTIQTLTYLPYFISTVVVASIVLSVLDGDRGVVNAVIRQLGFAPIRFLTIPAWFPHIYVWSGVWQFSGYYVVIYLAALTAIDPTLYESAEIDGAGRLAKMWYISIPGILPLIMSLFLLNVGYVLSVGFEKVFLLYNPGIYERADVISTYVYRIGLENARYDFATAVGLFNSVISLALIGFSNWLSRRLGQESLF